MFARLLAHRLQLFELSGLQYKPAEECCLQIGHCSSLAVKVMICSIVENRES